MLTACASVQIHYSKEGQAFKSRAVSMQIEILQSPWLYELMAFHINMREYYSKPNASVLLEGCSLVFDNEKPSLSFELFDSFKLNIDLTCSICLVSRTYLDSYEQKKSTFYMTLNLSYFHYFLALYIFFIFLFIRFLCRFSSGDVVRSRFSRLRSSLLLYVCMQS